MVALCMGANGGGSVVAVVSVVAVARGSGVEAWKRGSVVAWKT